LTISEEKMNFPPHEWAFHQSMTVYSLKKGVNGGLYQEIEYEPISKLETKDHLYFEFFKF
jgi:hypothetical protein